MADEIELKLSLAEGHQSRFLRHPLLKQALERHVETLDNVYYDTTDLSLRRRGIALRLRRKGQQWLQTVKLAGNSAAGLSSRPEWEEAYTGQFDFSTVDAPSVRKWLQRPELLASIVPVCETRFRRITWRFPAAPGSVLLTLDRGWILANGRREAISELELELAGAPVQAIFDIAGCLAARVALTPSVWSKAERGYRLHSGTSAAPLNAVSAALSPATMPFEAFRRIALSCLEHLQQNHAGTLSGEDPEYIRQTRLAIHRLRAALRLFAPVLPEHFAEALREPLSALIEQLDSLRALDVLITEIADPVRAALPDEPQLAVLVSDITRRRDAALAQAIALLASPDHGRMLLGALEALHAAPDAEPAAMSLLDFAGRRLRQLRNKVRKLAAAADSGNPSTLSALRIAVRRLRHALEFFAPLLPPRKLRRAVKQLSTAHHVLRQLDDLSHAGVLLTGCAGKDSALRGAVTLIAGWHGTRYARLQAAMTRQRVRLSRLGLPQVRPGVA